MSSIILVGSFDTKAKPFATLINMLRERGEEPVTIDTAVFAGDPSATYSADVVAGRAGGRHDELPQLGRAKAVSLMSEGAAAIVADLAEQGEVGAVVCMGGSNAASVFSRVAPVLPLGIPKILMATAVAADVRPIVGASDVVLVYPVVDVDGDSPILRRMIERLANTAVAIKSSSRISDEPREKKTVALSMYGVTTPCLQRVSNLVDEAGLDPVVFHANGTGGKSIEEFAAQGIVDGVVDATLAELGNELLGGAFPAGPDRMTNAARAGVPQVIAPGAIDMIAFGARNTVPASFESHQIVAHNELVTLVRTTSEECRAIGSRLAERLGRPQAGTVVCIPLGGTSMMDVEGGVFWNPEAVRAFSDGLQSGADSSIRIVESAHNINDPEFADLLFEQLKLVMKL